MPVQEIVVSTNYITLVVNTPSNIVTTVNQAAAPLSTVSKVAAEQTVIVGTPGPAGAPGPQGPAGSGGGSGNLYIQNAAPTGVPAQYAWIQTDYPSAGHQTMWVGY